MARDERCTDEMDFVKEKFHMVVNIWHDYHTCGDHDLFQFPVNMMSYQVSVFVVLSRCHHERKREKILEIAYGFRAWSHVSITHDRCDIA